MRRLGLGLAFTATAAAGYFAIVAWIVGPLDAETLGACTLGGFFLCLLLAGKD